jgi:hypothetical protein
MNATPQDFKEAYQLIRRIGKRHRMPAALIEDMCRNWKKSVREVEAQFKGKPFNFRNLK